MGRSVIWRFWMPRHSPFRYFKTSPEIIRLAAMLYIRFPLSLRNVEDLLHERGIEISHETVRYWWNRFGPMFAAEIRRRRVERMRAAKQWRWHLDEVYVKINGVPSPACSARARSWCTMPMPRRWTAKPRDRTSAARVLILTNHASSFRKVRQIGVICLRMLRLSGILVPSDWSANQSCISAISSACVAGRPRSWMR